MKGPLLPILFCLLLPVVEGTHFVGNFTVDLHEVVVNNTMAKGMINELSRNPPSRNSSFCQQPSQLYNYWTQKRNGKSYPASFYAIFLYTTSCVEPGINSDLRQSEVPLTWFNTILTLAGALNTLPPPHNVSAVYVGVHITQKEWATSHFNLNNTNNNNDYRSTEFFSTSTSVDAALKFARWTENRTMDEDGHLKVLLVLARQQGGKSVANYSLYPQEQEILFVPCSWFRFITMESNRRFKPDYDNVTVVYGYEIPDQQQPLPPEKEHTLYCELQQSLNSETVPPLPPCPPFPTPTPTPTPDPAHGQPNSGRAWYWVLAISFVILLVVAIVSLGFGAAILWRKMKPRWYPTPSYSNDIQLEIEEEEL